MQEPMGVPPLEEPKKNNTKIIVAVVVAILLCCCCVAIGSGVYLYQNGDEIFGLTRLASQFI